MSGKFAFVCKSCGHRVRSGQAGECKLPHACPACDHGVGWGNTLEAALDHKHCAPHKDAVEKCPRLKQSGRHGGRHIKTTLGGGLELHRVLVDENWEVLADATPERLTELGLTADEVEAHTPWAKGHVHREPVFHEVSAVEGVSVGGDAS